MSPLVVFSIFLFFSGFLFGDTLFWAFLRSVQILIFTCCVVFVVAFVVSKPYFPSGNITLDTVEPVSVSTYLSETGNLTEIPEDASKPYDLLMKALPISDNLKDVTFVKAELDGTALETSHALIDFLPYSTIGDGLGLVGLRTSSEPNTVYLVLNQTDCSEEEITVDVLHFLKSSGFLQPYSTPFMCWVLVFLVVVLYLLDLGLCFVWLNNL